MLGRTCTRTGWYQILLFLGCALVLPRCVHADSAANLETAPALRAGQIKGYLSPETIPTSLALLPPPPSAGSIAFALDEAFSQKAFALRDTSAFKLAALDAELDTPRAVEAFSCALNVPITEKQTPLLYALLRRVRNDAGLAGVLPKKYYHRSRPFVSNKQPICTPELATPLLEDGSYPSGHTTIGAVWAYVLTEISPNEADAILARGQAFALSRVICNVHWYSDTVQGRYMGANIYVRLYAEEHFRAELLAAKSELVTVRAEGLKPTRDCQEEARAIALQKELYSAFGQTTK